MENPLLVANLGNTNLRLVMFEGATPIWDRRLPTREAAAQLPDLPAACPVVLVSVVPPIAQSLLDVWRDRPVLVARAESVRDLAIAYDPPTALGADRLVNALAVRARYGRGLAVDCGTATTLTVVDETGTLRGGAIMPGLGTARASLHTGTAQLPEVPLAPIEAAWGATTRESIQLGLVQGHVGAIMHLVDRMRQALDPQAPVVLTGGWSELLRPLLPTDYHWEPDLTIEGARRLWLSQTEA